MKNKTFIKLSLFAIIFALVACSVKKGEVERAKIFATQACECKDKDCAEKILADFDPFIKKSKILYTSSSAAESLRKSVRKMVQCMIQKGLSRTKILSAFAKPSNN